MVAMLVTVAGRLIVVMMVVMTVIRMIMAAAVVPGRIAPIRLAVLFDDEAPADQDAVVMADQAAGHLGRQSAPGDVSPHRRLEIGKQVQHRGDEHVTGEAADQVEMQFHARLSPDGSFRGDARRKAALRRK